MEEVKLLALVERCYETMCRRRRPVFLGDSASVCSEFSEVLRIIRDVGLGHKLREGCQSHASIFGILLGEASTKRIDDPLFLLVVLLSCRLFARMSFVCGAGRRSFFVRQTMLHALADIKRWVLDVPNVSCTAMSVEPPERSSAVQIVEAFLNASRFFTEEWTAIFARFLVMAALRHELLFFVPWDIHAVRVYRCFPSSEGVSPDELSIVENAVLLPGSLPLEAQLLLRETCDLGGNIVLFSCSLALEGKPLDTFVGLLRRLDITFVASQRLLGPPLKEALYEKGVLPLERLSLQSSGFVQTATGATPFHSLCEFVAWVTSERFLVVGVCGHVGTVQKILVSSDGQVWLYGAGILATVLVPVGDPAVRSASIYICGQAFRLAHDILRDSTMHDPRQISARETFFADYLHRQVAFHRGKSVYHRDLLHVVRATLLSHAMYANFTLKNPLHFSSFEGMGRWKGSILSDGLSDEREPRVGCTEGLTLPSSEGSSNHDRELAQCADAIRAAIDTASLLYRVKES